MRKSNRPLSSGVALLVVIVVVVLAVLFVVRPGGGQSSVQQPSPQPSSTTTAPSSAPLLDNNMREELFKNTVIVAETYLSYTYQDNEQTRQQRLSNTGLVPQNTAASLSLDFRSSRVGEIFVRQMMAQKATCDDLLFDYVEGNKIVLGVAITVVTSLPSGKDAAQPIETQVIISWQKLNGKWQVAEIEEGG